MNDANAVCVRYKVSGRVQGVFFRASAQERALSLGLSGYAKNLPDGSVEVLACGEQMHLEALETWLQKGPPSAEEAHFDLPSLGQRVGLGAFGELDGEDLEHGVVVELVEHDLVVRLLLEQGDLPLDRAGGQGEAAGCHAEEVRRMGSCGHG